MASLPFLDPSITGVGLQIVSNVYTAQNVATQSPESRSLTPAVSWNSEPKPSTSKRKLDDVDENEADPHTKIRRVVREHVSHNPAPTLPMTTVICLHAAVAQKSYRSEKRFLCPPPVVHIEGPVWQMKSQQLSMVVVSETGERSFEQKAPLDSNLTASFKFLYVGGTAKAKSFQLSLDISEPTTNAPYDTDGGGPPGRVWASFDSAPVSIISKPSKKTAKTRNIASCILAGGPVSLFNRINAQTVRTKYMTIDNGALCASNVAWSAFNVNVIRRPNEPVPVGGPQPVTYGCEIILSDTHSGTATSPLIIRKVDKGHIANDDGGPVSQMQKIALQRVNSDGSRHYLSASGPPASPNSSSQANSAQQNGTHNLHFQAAKFRTETKDGVTVCIDEVDDHLCWTIVGISKFQYTFFDAMNENNKIPQLPITPFPTLFTAPIYRPNNNQIELTVSNFFYPHPTERMHKPLDIYLGNLGPLAHHVYQSGPSGPMTSAIPGAVPIPPPLPFDENGAPRFIPAGPLHTIVVVEMPPLKDIINALKGEDSASISPSPSTPHGDETKAKPNLADQIRGRSLPLLFIRAYDGVGYHSGRTIACENVFNLDHLSTAGVDTSWLASAGEDSMNGWTLRVM